MHRRGVMRLAAGASAPPAPWTPYDLPNRTLHLDASAGVAESGGVLTAWADQSPAAQTITITGSPTYTASDVGLNGEPSITLVSGARIQALALNRASALYFASVVYYGGGTQTIYDGTVSGTGRVTASIRVDGVFTHGGLLSYATSAGRSRLITATDGSMATTLNGVTLGTLAAGAGSGSGMSIGTNYLGGAFGARLGFLLVCSALSAGDHTLLQSYLATRYP